MNNRKWVCTTCSQDFTRRYSADRHIRNIHSGRANKVRLLDYIIGRVTGEYSPPDPLLFRHPNKQQDNLFSHDKTIRNKNFPFKSIANGSDNPPTHGNIVDPITNDNKYKSSRHDSDPIYQDLLKPPQKTQSNSPESQNGLSSKFGEIKKLWTPYFSSESLDYVLKRLALRVVEDGGDDSFVDQYLVELNKKVNFMNAVKQISSSKS